MASSNGTLCFSCWTLMTRLKDGDVTRVRNGICAPSTARYSSKNALDFSTFPFSSGPSASFRDSQSGLRVEIERVAVFPTGLMGLNGIGVATADLRAPSSLSCLGRASFSRTSESKMPSNLASSSSAPSRRFRPCCESNFHPIRPSKPCFSMNCPSAKEKTWNILFGDFVKTSIFPVKPAAGTSIVPVRTSVASLAHAPFPPLALAHLSTN